MKRHMSLLFPLRSVLSSTPVLVIPSFPLEFPFQSRILQPSVALSIPHLVLGLSSRFLCLALARTHPSKPRNILSTEMSRWRCPVSVVEQVRDFVRHRPHELPPAASPDSCWKPGVPRARRALGCGRWFAENPGLANPGNATSVPDWLTVESGLDQQ